MNTEKEQKFTLTKSMKIALLKAIQNGSITMEELKDIFKDFMPSVTVTFVGMDGMHPLASSENEAAL
jgi:hypothetical protein